MRLPVKTIARVTTDIHLNTKKPQGFTERAICQTIFYFMRMEDVFSRPNLNRQMYLSLQSLEVGNNEEKESNWFLSD